MSPARRRGFGSRLLHSILGPARTEYAPEGLGYVVALEAPAA